MSLPPGLPLRLRARFTVTRCGTRVLRALGLREPVIRWRGAVLRARRNLFERLGSARYSRPALHEMDRKLDEIIDRDGGFFVEAGGADGFTQSNTYYLERFRGWRDHRRGRVPARALSDLLDEENPARLDLLSLDVEGFEEQVLRGLDLFRHAPDWILIEMHDLPAGRRQIGGLLGDRYVEHALLSPLDVLYRRVGSVH